MTTPAPAPAREKELIAHLEGKALDINAPFARFSDDGKQVFITDEAVLARIDRERLSPSTLKTLSECVGKWAVTKTLPEASSVFKANELGTEAHQLFEDMFNLHPRLRTMAWMKNAIEARADELFAADGAQVAQPLAALVEPEAMPEAMSLLRQRWVYEVTANVRGMWQNEKPAETAVYQNEMSFNGITIGGAPATGFIDRITIDLVSMGVDPKSLIDMDDEALGALAKRAGELGCLKANDWKTGKVSAPKYSKGYHDQLRVYAIAIKAKTGHYPTGAELDYTKAFPTGDDELLKAYGYVKPDKRPTKGTKVSVDIRPTAIRKTEREFGKAWVALRSYVDEAAFPLEAGILCGWCPLVTLCPAAKASGKTAVLETLPTAEQVTIGTGEPLPYKFGRFGRIAEGTEAKAPTTEPTPTTSAPTNQEPFMSEPDYDPSHFGDTHYDDPADRIIAAADAPVPDAHPEPVPEPKPRAKRAPAKKAAVDPANPTRTSQRTPRTRSSGVAAALEDAPVTVPDEPVVAVAPAPEEAPEAAVPEKTKAPAKARTPRVSAKAKAEAAALAKVEAEAAEAEVEAGVEEAAAEVALVSALIPNDSTGEPAQPEPAKGEKTDPWATPQVPEPAAETPAVKEVMTKLKEQLHLAKEAASEIVKARNEALADQEAAAVSTPIKLSRPNTGATMMTAMPILTEDVPFKEPAGGLLNPNSYAAGGVFGTSGWAMEMLVAEGQKITVASMDGLTNVLGTLIVRLHSEFSDEPKWQDGGNTRSRGILRSVIPDVPKPWGGTTEEWESWGEKVFKRSRLILLTGYSMYAEGLSDDPYADLAAATTEAR